MKTILLFFIITVISSPAFASDKIFRVRIAEDLGTLDWNYGELNPEVVYQLMEGLFSADHNGKPIPAVAKSFRWNKNKTEISITLKNRKWSDGKPVCAQDFVDSWSRLLSKEFASPYAHYGHLLKSFSAKSCGELNIIFNRPSPEALANFSHYVYFPIRLDQIKQSPKIFTQGTGLIVNGPYKVKQWDLNKKLQLEMNPDYSGAKATIPEIEFLFLGEENTAKIMFEKGEIDWMRDIPALLRSEALEKSAEFHIYPSFTTFYYGLNSGNSKLLEDLEIRKALSESLNRNEIPKVLGKENRGVRNWVAKEIYPALKSAKEQKVDWEKVRLKLKGASTEGKMDILLRVYNKASHKLFAEWAQGQWEKKLGIRIPIEVQDGKVYWKEIYTNPGAIHISGITAPYGHPRAYFQEFLTTSTANWTDWKSKEYDAAVNAEKFQKAEDLLLQGGYIIPLYTRDTAALVQKKWKGFYINPLGQTFLSAVH